MSETPEEVETTIVDEEERDEAPEEGKGSDTLEGAVAESPSANRDVAAPSDAAKPEGAVAVRKGSTKGIAAAFAIMIVIVCIVAFAFMGQGPSDGEVAGGTPEEPIEAVDEQPTASLPESPVDWAEQKGINDNIYAWISVPGTAVEQPILQHPLADNFYLRHDIYGNETIEGSVYTQKKHNSTDFTADPVTLVYGHTFQDNDTMFSTLHNYEDPTFFEEHPYFYIYTPEHNLTYKVVSAYETDNKLILAKWDVSNPEKQQEYFDLIVDPGSWSQQIRETERLVSGQDHVVQLSTCTKPSDGNKRYIVTGVLVNVEPVAAQEVGETAVEEVPEEDLQ